MIEEAARRRQSGVGSQEPPGDAQRRQEAPKRLQGGISRHKEAARGHPLYMCLCLHLHPFCYFC